METQPELEKPSGNVSDSEGDDDMTIIARNDTDEIGERNSIIEAEQASKQPDNATYKSPYVMDFIIDDSVAGPTYVELPRHTATLAAPHSFAPFCHSLIDDSIWHQITKHWLSLRLQTLPARARRSTVIAVPITMLSKLIMIGTAFSHEQQKQEQEQEQSASFGQ